MTRLSTPAWQHSPLADSHDRSPSPQPSRFARAWQMLKAMLLNPMELQVWQRRDRNGNIGWHAYDPITRRSVHDLSEAEMRIWIEQNYDRV